MENREGFFLRQWFAIGLTLLLLLSSCTTKRGIKTLLNLPVNTTQAINNLENTPLATFKNNCLGCEDLKIVTVEPSDISQLKNLSPLAIQAIIYSLYSPVLTVKEVTEPIHYTPNISGEVPRYLLFKKLILYNA